MRLGKQIDPLILTGAAVAFLLVIDGDPWWKIDGASSNKILTVQVSPYYFLTIATGALSELPPYVSLQ